MLVLHMKTIGTTHKTKVVGEEVVVEILKIMKFVEEATTISVVKTLVIRMIIKTRITFNVTIAKNMDTIQQNERTQDEGDNTKKT